MAVLNVHTNVHTFDETRRALQRFGTFLRDGLKHNLTATVDPNGSNTSGTITGSTDDESEGYFAGSFWYNQTSNALFICEDAALGNATWQSLTGATAPISGNSFTTITGDSGSASTTSPTETLNFEGGTQITTTAVAGSPDKVTIDWSAAITNLSDVSAKSGSGSTAILSTITSIASGEILKWDGSDWINNTLAEAGISAVGHTHPGSDISGLTNDALTVGSATGGIESSSILLNTAGTSIASGLVDIDMTGEIIFDLQKGLSWDHNQALAELFVTEPTDVVNRAALVLGVPAGSYCIIADGSLSKTFDPGADIASPVFRIYEGGITPTDYIELRVNSDADSFPLVNWTTGDFTFSGSVNLSGDIVFPEKADHSVATPLAAFGYLWVKSTAPTTLIFTDDTGADTTLGSGGGNAFETIITDPASETLTASASDQLTLKEGSNRIAIDGVAATDVITLDVVEANIDHDALTNFVAGEHLLVGAIDHDLLLNFVAAEHVDWAGAGTGTIHTDNYIEGGAGTDTTALHDDVANEITAITAKTSAAASDEFVMEDSAASFVKKAITFANLEGALTIGSLSGTLQLADLSDVSATTGSGSTVLFNQNPTITIEDSGTSTIIDILNLDRTTSGTAANGIGGSINFKIEDADGGSPVTTARIDVDWEDAAAATRDGRFEVHIRNAGAIQERLRVDTAGVDVTGTLSCTGDLSITASDLLFSATGSTIQANTVIKLTLNANDVTVTPRLIVSDNISFTAGKVIEVGTTDVITLTSTSRVTVDVDLSIGGHAHFGTTLVTQNAGGAFTIDWTDSNKQEVVLTANAGTITFTAPSGPCNVVLKIKQDATGGWGVAAANWPSTVKWPADVAIVTSEGASEYDIVTFFFDGTNYNAMWGKDFS